MLNSIENSNSSIVNGKDFPNPGNKRKKRKLSESSNERGKLKKLSKSDDYDDSNVNSLAKKIVTAKVQANEEQDETHDHETPLEEERVTEKEANRLTGKSFRATFNSAQGMSMLRKFVSICRENKGRDLAGEYLYAGGSALEVLRLLDTSSKKNIDDATTVFSAMQIIIMKILAEYPQYHSSAVEACRHLINTHLSSVHFMLSHQSNPKQRKVILRLLATIVSLGGTLPRELLGHLSFHPQALEVLVKHSKSTDPESVRTCFIHFLLAFLVDGNVSIIRALLEKRGVLASIFPDLIYDSCSTVQLVLTTVKNYILENPGISKTVKLHTFSTPVVQSIVALYNWKGPGNWPGCKKNRTDINHVNPEKKEVAVEAVHDFLITLLTSNRYGIIFNDRSLGTSGRKHNSLANTILQSLDRPWEHAKPSNLVIKILVACPDLVKAEIAYIEPFLEPRPSKRWMVLMRFINEVINSMCAETCLTLCLPELTISQLVTAITTLTVPAVVVKSAIFPSFTDDNVIPRYEATNLLTTMLSRLKKFVEFVQNNIKDSADLALFNRGIAGYILKTMPNLGHLLNVWNKAFLLKEQEHSPDQEEISLIPTREEHVKTILNLLYLYKDVCPQLLDIGYASEANLQPTILLTRLDDSRDFDEEELIVMKVKALQFLLILDPSEFSPNKDLFRTTLPFFISLLGHKSNNLDSYARTAIHMMLNASDLFEGCVDQIDIWLNSFSVLEKSEEKEEVAVWFVKLMRDVVKHTDKYIDCVINAEEVAGEEVLGGNSIEEIFNDLSERNIANQTMGTLRLRPPTSIPVLLCGALKHIEKHKSEVLLRYISYVMVHTMHCQVAPGALIHLARNISAFLPSWKYLESWLHGNEPTHIKKPFHSKSLICKLSKALLGSNQIQIDEIFSGETELHFKIENEEIKLRHSLSNFEILSLLRLALFYFARFTQREDLTEERIYNCKILIASLICIAYHVDSEGGSNYVEQCLTCIFTHPTVFHYFSPLYKKKNITKRNVTVVVLDICKALLIDIKQNQIFPELIRPFKNKLIEEFQRSVEKRRKITKTADSEIALELIDVLQFNVKDVIQLLTIVMQLPKQTLLSENNSGLSMWGLLIPKLIGLSCTVGRYDGDGFLTLDASLIKRISFYLMELKKIDSVTLDDWETNLHNYLHSFPHNIAAINPNLFASLLKHKINPSTIKLISFFANRNVRFISQYLKFAANNEDILRQSSLTFALLSSNLHYQWQEPFLKKVYDHYKTDILQYFCDPLSSRLKNEENIEALSRLIETNVDMDMYNKVSQTISSNVDKLDKVDVSYMKLLQSLFNKASTLEIKEENPLETFSHIVIRIIVSTLKTDSKNSEKLCIFCDILSSTIDCLREKDNNFVFDDLSKNYSWPQFTRFSLKLGLQESKGEKIQIPLLKALIKVCNVAYKDNSDNEYVKTLFEMTTSHSKFLDVMLGSSSVKRYVVELLWILVQKNNKTMAPNQVPLYLAAYNATLSESDQFILMLLQYYESHDVKLNDYRPYLWGNAAATHYAVKGEMNTALWRQPSTSQVLDLLISETVDKTIKDYPVDRGLKCDRLHLPDDVYDPAFYLPLLCHLLFENNVVACHKVTQNGALALAIAACASTDTQVRLAAYTVISRYYFHLEATSSKEKLLWMHFVHALQNGMVSLEIPLSDVRLSCIVSTFLARTSLIATQPLSPLYTRLQMFLMAKPALDLQTVPELLQLFNSSDVEHKAHRHWILEVIRDGLKTEKDMYIAFHCVLFRMLFDFCSSILCDRHTKNLIFEVIRSAIAIPKAGLLLVSGYGLLPWLSEIVKTLDPCECESIAVVVDIARNLLDAVSRVKRKLQKTQQLMLLDVLIYLKNLFTKNTNISCYARYVDTLQRLISVEFLGDALRMNDMKNIIELSKKILGRVDECEYMLRYGCKLLPAEAENIKSENDLVIARVYLRKLILTWCKRNLE